MRPIDADALTQRVQSIYELTKGTPEAAALACCLEYIKQADTLKVTVKSEHRCKECKYFKRDYQAQGLRGDCIEENRQAYRSGYYRNRRQGNEPACTRYFKEKQDEANIRQ